MEKDKAEATVPAVELALKSDPGRDPEKQVNEDACGHRITRFGHLCVVCDGMGGHAGGREASNLALETIFAHFDLAPEGTPPHSVLHDALALANHKVYAMATGATAHSRPGSTVVAVLMHAGGTEIAHVGDSRCYLVHETQIFQVTKDHSMVQDLVDAGLLTPAQAAVHPNANQITRALGMGPEVEVSVRVQPVAHVTGDAFVLCSDGLSDLVEPAEMLGIVGSVPAAQAAGQLIDLANARGGHDNVTVLILRAMETAAGQPAHVARTIGGATVTDTVAEEMPTLTGLEAAPQATLVQSGPPPQLVAYQPPTPERTTMPGAAPPSAISTPVMLPAAPSTPTALPSAPSAPRVTAFPDDEPESRQPRPRARLGPLTILSIVLAAVSIVVVVLGYLRASERHHRHATTLDAGSPEASASAASTGTATVTATPSATQQ